MCTLIIASRVWDDTPLLVAANRDEALDRAAEPPARRDWGSIPVLAPRDQRGGGTWLGLNARGLFVGITNRFRAERDTARESRGLLVKQALAQTDAAQAADEIAALDPQRYNPFHLFLADRERLLRVWSDGDEMHREELDPGIHLLTERSLGAGHSEREQLLNQELARMPPGGPPTDDALHALLARHAEPSFEGLCVHWPELNYGTRSSTILRLGHAAGEVRLLHADGPPCQAAHQDFSQAARDLLAAT